MYNNLIILDWVSPDLKSVSGRTHMYKPYFPHSSNDNNGIFPLHWNKKQENSGFILWKNISSVIEYYQSGILRTHGKRI